MTTPSTLSSASGSAIASPATLGTGRDAPARSMPWEKSQAIAVTPPAASSTVDTAVPAATSSTVWPGPGAERLAGGPPPAGVQAAGEHRVGEVVAAARPGRTWPRPRPAACPGPPARRRCVRSSRRSPTAATLPGLLRWDRDRGSPDLAGRPPRAPSRPSAVDDAGALLDLLPAEGALSWVRRGEGLVGWGEAARLEVTGPGRAGRGRRVVGRRTRPAVDVDDDAAAPRLRPGPVRQHRVRPGGRDVGLRRPRGRRSAGGTASAGSPPSATSTPATVPRRPQPADDDAAPRLRYADGALDPASWCAAVATAVRADRGRRAGQGRAGPRPAGLRRRARSTRAGCCGGWPPASPTAGPSPSTACSAPRRSCCCGAPAGSCPPACWPARRPAGPGPTTSGSPPR